MSLSESEVETLERNSPNGLFESALEGASFWTLARSVLALEVSPDLMSAMRLLRALLNEFCLVLEVLEVDALAISLRRLLL
jgi:hypothetical protein